MKTRVWHGLSQGFHLAFADEGAGYGCAAIGASFQLPKKPGQIISFLHPSLCPTNQPHKWKSAMKKITFQILLVLSVAAAARADTSLTINSSTPFGCLQNASIMSTPLQVSGSFTLPDSTGTGTISSSVTASAPSFGYPPEIYFFNYTIDLSHVTPQASHCIKLLIHFGTPDGCDTDEVWGSPSQIQSATLAPFGDITLVFAGGCLEPTQPYVPLTMFSEAPPKTATVTVIDDYVAPNSGVTNETQINVSALVPDIPPDPPFWERFYPSRFSFIYFQGLLNSTNPAPPFTNRFINGSYDFLLQLLAAPTNGLAISEVVTQTAPVVNGLFNLPLPFDPITVSDGSSRWLSIGVRPSALPAVQFTPIGPPLPLTPTPQAIYAYTAGSVADLTPGQAVTSLNGLTDAINLQAGNGIFLGTNGNTLTISAVAGVPSDQNIKTDFTTVQSADILAKLAALPIQGWRYTNEVAGVRHLGPMAQDFKAAFGLGQDDKFIAFVDEQGVALAAIQALNRKLDQRDAEIADLKQQLAQLKSCVQHQAEKPR